MALALEKFELVGTLCSIGSEGNCAIAKLDSPVEGFELAVISGEAKGRMQLMSTDKSGRLIKGERISMTAVKSIDAFRVLRVSPILN